MYAIILCGGSGSRLWPLSRSNYPKQFLKLEEGDLSLLQSTFTRVSHIVPRDRVFFVTHEDHYWNVVNQVAELYPTIDRSHIIKEPMRKNTMPATILGMLGARAVYGPTIDTEPCIVTPADHAFLAPQEFTTVARYALAEIENKIGLIGVTPTHAHTGYGYVHKGPVWKNGVHTVSTFREKPNAEVAQELYESGEWVWNSGIYLMTAATLQEELAHHAPEYTALMESTLEEATLLYKDLPARSIDHAISEHSEHMVVFEGAHMQWSDIGSFDTVHERGNKQGIVGPVRHIGIDSRNITVVGTRKRLVATIGLDDIIIVENNDTTLVCKAGESEKVKQLVESLQENDYSEVDDQVLVHRPWGSYEILIDEPQYKVKRITVLPGAKLSLQSHQHRAEHWVVVSGLANVRNGDTTYLVGQNEGVYVEKGNMHQLGNAGNVPLEIIEVQTGSYLGEDDITRYEDDYARVETVTLSESIT